MNRPTMLKVHKRIAVTMSTVFLAWLVSGIVMLIPKDWLNMFVRSGSTLGMTQTEEVPLRVTRAPRTDFTDILISIPQAIAALEADLGRQAHVNGVKVARLGTRLVYEITLKDGMWHLVDAFTGTPTTITQTMAEDMARDAVPHAGKISSTALLTQRDLYYWGPLPVYKIAFDDSRGTVVYVSASTGHIELSYRLRRIPEGDFQHSHLQAFAPYFRKAMSSALVSSCYSR